MTPRLGIVKMDWYSFSFPVERYGIEDEREHMHDVVKAFNDKCPVLGEIFNQYGYTIGGGRRPYNWSISTTGITIYGSLKMDWQLCEISGQGCTLLRTHDNAIEQILIDTHKRCTRIDLCVDLLDCEYNMVDEFIGAGYSNRFKAVSRVVSGNGTTQYIGSRKSERMCRVYQYNEPHPRAQNMRIEIELKQKRAKECALSLLDNSIVDEFARQVGDYQFSSSILNFEVSSAYVDKHTITSKQRENGTLLWILRQCVPAFHRLVADGTISNPTDFLHDYFIAPLKDKT